jgi:hypothetical protein
MAQAEQVTVKVLRGARKALNRQEKAQNLNETLTLIREPLGRPKASHWYAQKWGKLQRRHVLRPVLSLALTDVYIACNQRRRWNGDQ